MSFSKGQSESLQITHFPLAISVGWIQLIRKENETLHLCFYI